jgi:hypothetical protein
MALKLYTVIDDTEINNNDNPIVSYHDTTDGTYEVSKFYLSNKDDTTKGYSNITVSLKDNAGQDLPISQQTGIYYQLLAIETIMDIPSLEFWEKVPHSNSITLNSIPKDEESYVYFALRIYVPRATGAKYLTESNIVVTAAEIA